MRRSYAPSRRSVRPARQRTHTLCKLILGEVSRVRHGGRSQRPVFAVSQAAALACVLAYAPVAAFTGGFISARRAAAGAMVLGVNQRCQGRPGHDSAPALARHFINDGQGCAARGHRRDAVLQGYVQVGTDEERGSLRRLLRNSSDSALAIGIPLDR